MTIHRIRGKFYLSLIHIVVVCGGGYVLVKNALEQRIRKQFVHLAGGVIDAVGKQ